MSTGTKKDSKNTYKDNSFKCFISVSVWRIEKSHQVEVYIYDEEIQKNLQFCTVLNNELPLFSQSYKCTDFKCDVLWWYGSVCIECTCFSPKK